MMAVKRRLLLLCFSNILDIKRAKGAMPPFELLPGEAIRCLYNARKLSSSRDLSVTFCDFDTVAFLITSRPTVVTHRRLIVIS